MDEKDYDMVVKKDEEEDMSGTEEEVTYNNDLFPTEILEQIFKNLFFSDLTNCLQVCRRWNSVGSYLKEEVCKNECAIKYNPVYKDAYRRGRLSWESLLKSLQMWTDVKSGYIVRVYLVVLLRHVHTAKKNPQLLQFLSDGVLSYPRLAMDKPQRAHSIYTLGDCNSITYLDAHTMRIINTVQYNFIFNMYEENDDFIVFREKNLNLRVLTKVDKQVHNLGKVYSGLIYRGASRFFVVRDRIFFITHDHVICMVTYSSVGGRGVLSRQALVVNWDVTIRQIEILAVACPQRNTIKVLISCGYVVTLVQEGNTVKTTYISLCVALQKELTACTSMEVANLLREHGFDWCAPSVYSWLAPFDADRRDSRQFCMMNNTVVHVYDKLVIVAGTKRDALAIYYNPYRDGKLCLYDAQPNVHLMMSQFHRDSTLMSTSTDQRRVLQIGVIEVEGGHRVYLFYARKIMVLDVSNGSNKRGERGRHGRLSCSHAKVIRVHM